MSNVKLSPPWDTFVNEVKALFNQDPEVTVKFIDDEYLLKLFVSDADKAIALEKLMVKEKVFGNVTLKVEVIPPNMDTIAKEQLFQKAFNGNPSLSFTQSYDTPLGNITYIVFQKKVVQFYNDQMNDINGNKSMLFEDIASDVFGTEHSVFYCTDAEP